MTRHMTGRHIAWGSAAVLAFLVLVPGTASAQSSIAGVVRDSSGAVLPGVTVEAASPALIEKVRTAVTDGDGNYKIIDLRPGAYTVTFSLAGFSTVKRDGIDLPASFTATVSVELAVGSLEETITVSGAAPLVDVQGVATQTLMSKEMIEAIPSARSLQGYAVLTPGVISQGGLGALPGSSQDAAVRIHGAPTNESIFAMDGVDQGTLHGSGQSMMYRNNQVYISEINIVTGGGNAELPFGAGMANIIPKEGGNTFAFGVYLDYSGKGLAKSNLTDDLRAQGFTSDGLNNLIRKWEVSPSLGGRILRDKLWFFGSYSNSGTIQSRAGVFENLTPQGWRYTPDLTHPAEVEITQESQNLRLTWQVTPRNKLGIYTDIAPFIIYHRRYETPTAPEATQYAPYIPNAFKVISWKSPVTSRVLLDATASHMLHDLNARRQSTETCRCSAPSVTFDDVSVTEATTSQVWRSNPEYAHWIPSTYRFASSASYITGSHAFKTGFQLHKGFERFIQGPNGARTYTLRNGLPSSITQYANPIEFNARISAELGLYAQDQWTLKRLTLTGGLRYDYINAGADAQHLDGGLWMPARDFPGTTRSPLWKDFNPRMAASYDLFGDGKTAIKASLNRSIAVHAVSSGGLNNPVVQSVVNVTRTWNDANGNFAPDCVLTNFLANGECGQISDLNFGQNNPNATRFDAELLSGLRPYSWETTALVQRQVANGISLSLGYYRRDFLNFRVNDNVLVGPSDFSHYCVTAPVDARLPNGGGQICGLYDVSPALFGRTQTLVRDAALYGEQTQTYNGFDLTENIRLPNGATISGGVSWSRTKTSACFVVDSPGALRFCEVNPPFQPNVSFVGFVPLPWWGIMTSATYRDYPPAEILANRTTPNAEILPSLGRNLSNGANGTVSIPLVEPGTLYGPRPRQLDFRVSKRFRVGRARIMGNIDFFNLFNGTGITTMNGTYGSQWQRPTLLQQGRYLKFSGQLDF
jgi:hypothetical protein